MLAPRCRAGQSWAVVPLVLLQHLLATWSQDPTPAWKPNRHTSLGLTCAKDAPNPNDPGAHHAGGCGCENTLLRLDGQLYLMESHSHGLDDVFPGQYNSSAQGDNSFFRLRNFKTGITVANVSQSIGHSFCAAVADHERRQVWVFCSANARGNKLNPGRCGATPRRGCYVGAWNASFDDLTSWSPTRKALVLPAGTSLFNNDVALVRGAAAAAAAALPGAAPPHQAAMIIEGRADKGVARPGPFAINTGTDGDLGDILGMPPPCATTPSKVCTTALAEGGSRTARYDRRLCALGPGRSAPWPRWLCLTRGQRLSASLPPMRRGGLTPPSSPRCGGPLAARAARIAPTPRIYLTGRGAPLTRTCAAATGRPLRTC